MVFLSDYTSVITIITLSFLISALIVALSFLLQSGTADAEKVSTYECGFSAFEDARQQFEVKFFVVAILFIIFDLEIAFIFPWAVLTTVSLFSFLVLFIFIIILFVGLVYEWVKGGLEWQ